ncbi:MAG: nitrous oxide reductase family maturation protein NosD [Ferruginibacter sp.]
MKKLLLIAVIQVAGQLSLQANTLYVGPHRSITSIRTALAMAANGDTIRVDAGTYREKNLVINKQIMLLGINQPVLDGEKKYEILSIKANAVVIDGFTVRHSGSSSIEDIGGIKIYQCRDVVIRNNILEDNFFGIYSLQGTNCLIQNNHLSAFGEEELESGNGIHCWKSDSMRIIGNTITGHRDGIYFEFVTNSIIWRNTSYKNIRYGLHFMFSQNNSYVTNIFRNNGAGVAVMYSHGVKMFNNYFQENWGDAAYGLLLKEITDSYIEGNHFEKNTSGVYMEGASRIVMKRNSIRNNGWGLKIQASCMDIEVTHNDFTGNTFDVGTNGSLVLNTFNNNYWDKYEGYDINKDGTGDIPYRPVSLYSMIVEKNPPAMMLFRSFMTSLMDKTEKIIPTLTPENLKDEHPLMKRQSD